MAFRVAALLLAAGSSRRMGTSKQLLLLRNKPVLRHCVDTIAAAGLQDLVVVTTGTGQAACSEALHGAKVRIAVNNVPDSQMADSVRTGLRAVDETCSGVLVCLVDHPLVSRATYQAIINAHQRSPGKIIIPAFEGRRGHPSLFPFPVINDIFFLPTLRDLVREDGDRVLVVDVPDEGVVLDMDTQEDYRAIAARFATLADGVPTGERHVQ